MKAGVKKQASGLKTGKEGGAGWWREGWGRGEKSTWTEGESGGTLRRLRRKVLLGQVWVVSMSKFNFPPSINIVETNIINID